MLVSKNCCGECLSPRKRTEEGLISYMMSFFIEYYLYDQMKKDKIGENVAQLGNITDRPS